MKLGKIKLAAILGVLAFSVFSAKGYCSTLGDTVLLEKKADASIPLMFASEYTYTYDTNQTASKEHLTTTKVAYTGLWDGDVKPYVKLGAYKGESKDDSNNSTLEVETEMEVAYGAGIEAILKKFSNDVSVFGGVDFLYINADLDSVKLDGVKQTLSSEQEMATVNTFIGIGTEVEFANGMLKPYVGASYQHSRVKSYVNIGGATTSDDDAEDDILPFAGVNYEKNNWAVGVEGSYLDSDASISASFTLQF